MHRVSVSILGLVLVTGVTASLPVAPTTAEELAPASSGSSTWVTGDLTRDGRDEVAGFSPLTGVWTLGVARDDRLEFSVPGRFATRHGWLAHVAGDFSGDGRDEVASFHRNGNWVVSAFEPSGVSSSVRGRFRTTSGWLAHVAGDVSGDGRDEVASFHRNGNWVVSDPGRKGSPSTVWARVSTARGWLAHLAADLTGDAVDELLSFHGNSNWIVTALDDEQATSDVRARLEPPFHWHAAPISPAERDRMRGTTWRAGCPVGLDELRAVDLTHYDFDGKVRLGRLIAHADAIDDLEEVFAAMFRTSFPIASVVPAHRYDGDDDAIMAANASHAFNCRPITGGTGWSEHAYGVAVDLNPVQNPYRRGDDVKPPAGSAYLDRDRHRPGMLLGGEEPMRTFDRLGWHWGGRWNSLVDYMHVERPR